MNSTLKTFILMAGMTGLFLVVGQALGGEQGMMLALFLALCLGSDSNGNFQEQRIYG